MSVPRTTLEQWRVLQTVIERGGFAQAAEALHRSQSSISYTVARLQAQLPVALLDQSGRKAVLTEAGEVLLRRSKILTDEALRLERLAASLAQGWEAELQLAVEVVFPSQILFAALREFTEACGEQASEVRLQLIESVLSGTDEALFSGRADLVISGRIPPGFLGEPLLLVEFVAVAHRDHPLHHLDRPISADDLRAARQLVVRDSGLSRSQDIGWLGAEQRWTVSHIKTSIEAIRQGLGFAWLPEAQISAELTSGELRPLPLREGGRHRGQLYLIYADRDSAGPATRELAAILQRHCVAHSGS
ncbi:MAG: LysR family transcriptional regulator [Thiohalomonadaceae bacterium]